MGVDRSGVRNPALSTVVAVGSYSSSAQSINIVVAGNTIAYSNTVVGSQGGNVLFTRNSAVLSNLQRGSSTPLYNQVELTKVVFDAAGTTRLEGNINAAGAGLYRVEVFSNPTPFG